MKLKDVRMVILAEEGFEDLEFWVPYMRLVEEGAQLIIAGHGKGRTVSSKSGGLTARIEVDASSINPGEVDGVVIPGGWAPDKLRRYPEVLDLVRKLDQAGKVVAMICHAGLVGISAGIVSGRKVTGSLGIKDDLENAGANWVDEAAFVDSNQVWGRVVKDIPAFCRELVSALNPR